MAGPSVESLIRAVIKQGELTHLTLAPTGRNEWQASWRPASGNGYRVAIDKDPIDALREVFKGVKAKPEIEDDEDLI